MSHLHVQRLMRVKQEYYAVQAAVDHVADHWPQLHREDAFVTAGVQAIGIQAARNKVGDTYIVRAFSEFEAMLREHLHLFRPPIHVPYTAEGLINRAAVRNSVSNDWRAHAHDVRVYRNFIVHQSSAPVRHLFFDEAITALNRFLSVLPDLS